MLTDALHSAMLAFTGPESEVEYVRLARPGNADLFRRLNARHRAHLIVSDLMHGVTVVSVGTDDLNRMAQLTVGSTDVLTLCLDTNLSTLCFWRQQIKDLRTQKWNRDDRLAEIDLQQTDLHSFLGLAVAIAADTHPWLMVLLDAVQEMAFRVATEMKDICRMPRPHMLAHDLAPPIRTPSHSAYPSGHATEAFAAAAVLGALYPQSFMLLRQMACRIALNRGYAGVHYPVDHHAGALVGDLVGRHIVKHMFGVDVVKPGVPASFNFAATAPSAVFTAAVEDYALTSPILAPLTARPTMSQAAGAPAALAKVNGILPWLAGKVLGDVGTDAP